MLTVTNSKEWKLKRKQREGPVNIINTRWSRIRQIVLKRDNCTCQVCGKSNLKLAVHHIKPRKEGGEDSMDNLVTVCHGSCHKKIEPIKPKVTLFVTTETYRRFRNLIGYGMNDEMMIIRLCEELENSWV
jgi:5-methylcytosine-specific restriction endonuclease McrA